MRRFIAIIRKELIHISRDPRSLFIIFLMPVLMIFIFGYAVRLDVRNIPLVVMDLDHSPTSRSLVQSFESSGYFHVESILWSHENPDLLFRKGITNRRPSPLYHSFEPFKPMEISTTPSENDHHYRLPEELSDSETMVWRDVLRDLLLPFNEKKIPRAILVIPSDFGASTEKGTVSPVQFLTDASDSNTATIASQYAEQIMAAYWQSRLPEIQAFPDIRVMVLFNPELESTHFIVPGLVAILFIMVCALLTSMTITREKESGTLEQILVSPVRPWEIILGKVLPYVLLAAMVGSTVISIAMLWFDVPFRGNVLELALYSMVYIICSLALGIMISTKVNTVQVALMIALITTMLPSVMLSGFMFPISSMPTPIRIISHIVPARYYLVIIRGIMLKAVGFSELRSHIAFLGIISFILLTISIRRFKASLE